MTAMVHEQIRLIRPLNFGFQKETWVGMVAGKRVLVHRYTRDAFCIPRGAILRKLRHPNIQRFLFESQDEEGSIIQVFTLIEGHNLYEVLKKRGCDLKCAQKLKVLSGLVRGLCYLHKASVLHGDIKPSNAMVRNRDLRGVWIDLCALDATPADTTSVYCGTPPYIAKEVLEGSYPTRSSEVFAFAILSLACLSGVLPPADMGLIKEWQSSCLGKVRASGGARSLISALNMSLSDNPEARPRIFAIEDALLEALRYQE
jgi:serine/threonine protein kinase